MLGLSGGAAAGTGSTTVPPGFATPGEYSAPPSAAPEKAVGPTTSVLVLPAYSPPELDAAGAVSEATAPAPPAPGAAAADAVAGAGEPAGAALGTAALAGA